MTIGSKEAPRGGAGIEIRHPVARALWISEAPRGGAGIEIVSITSPARPAREAPRGGAGIEIAHGRAILSAQAKPLVEGLVLKFR